MPGYDVHPGVDATTKLFPPSVRTAIVGMAEMVAALTAAKDRTNHTGTQLAATISDFNTAADARVNTLVPVASDTVQGKIERATTAEVQTMTDTARAVTPAGLAAASVSAATANRIVRRDANGRAQFAEPSAGADSATLTTVRNLAVIELTSAARDTLYGVPSTDAARVALANLKPVIYNMDTGFVESYYAVTGLSGLTARGLVAGSASGWYPISGNGPRLKAVPSAPQTMTTGNYFQNYAQPGTGASYREGGSSLMTLSAGGHIIPAIAGRYRCEGLLAIQAGGGSGALYLVRNANPTGADIIQQDALTLNATYGMLFKLPASDTLFAANQGLAIYAAAVGSAIFAPGANGTGLAAGYLFMEYMGPPLVNN